MPALDLLGMPIDYRDQYAAYSALHRDLGSQAENSDALAKREADKAAYEKQYGGDASKAFDFTPFMANKADALLGLAGSESTTGKSDKYGNTTALRSNDFSNNEAAGVYALQQAKQFDSNARLQNGVLLFDRSKLPQFAGGGTKQYDKYGGLANLTENNAGDRVKDPRYIIHDENYGDYTLRGNLSQASNDAPSAGIMGQMEKYMPSIIGMIMSMASGGAMSPGLIQAASGVGGGGSMGNLLAMIGRSIANSYVPGSGSLINMAYGASQRGHHA
jgi:hypothetical protein